MREEFPQPSRSVYAIRGAHEYNKQDIPASI